MKKTIILLSLFAIVLMGCEGTKQNNNSNSESTPTKTVEQQVPAKEAHPTYVLSDELGERFLLLAYFDDDTNPQAPDSLNSYKYIIYNNRYYPVTFKGFQLENKEENMYRETYYNFNNLSGWLYTMQNGKLLDNPSGSFDVIWDAPLLVGEKFKAENTIYPMSNYTNGIASTSELSETLTKVFEKRYDRKILRGWCNAIFGENNEYQFVNIQFKNKGTEALGVSALVKNNEIVAVIEDPAEWNEESVWRVDDGGEFGGLYIDFITSKDGVLTFYTSDSGPEGTFYQNFILDGDHFYAGDVSKSFYQAPY